MNTKSNEGPALSLSVCVLKRTRTNGEEMPGFLLGMWWYVFSFQHCLVCMDGYADDI